jgi:hypothetical protein
MAFWCVFFFLNVQLKVTTLLRTKMCETVYVGPISLIDMAHNVILTNFKAH